MDEINWITQMNSWIKEDMEMICGECTENEGVLRAIAENLGVSGAAAVVEAAIEGMSNGDDNPYPVVHFNLTLARDIEPEYFGGIAQILNDINVVIQSGGYPSFGSFCLYKPLSQIFYGYRLPINVGSLETERENIRFFLATVFDQLDIFIDLVLFACQGNVNLTIEEYLDYLKKVDDLNNIDERIRALQAKLEELDRVVNQQGE